jgi:YidC/Oxa1 family membrane protein insertase
VLGADGRLGLGPAAKPVIVPGTDLDGPALGGLRYPHLWWPLHPVARIIEALLAGLRGTLGISWGMAIMLLAIMLRVLLLPVSRYTRRVQQRVARLEGQLAPRVAEIRRTQKGEAAHMATLAAYKDLGISPYFRLRPMAGTLIQVPLLVAIFNVLGGMPQLEGARFLWIADLSLPDTIGKLPFAIPMLGQEISLLPLLMTACAVIAGRTYRNPEATPAMQRSQRRNIYVLAALFLLLFYPFPAAMVWFWLATNLLQLGQQWIGSARAG